MSILPGGAHGLLLCLLILSPSCARQARITPVDLRCNYLENPEAIEAEAPRLSWINEPADGRIRGERQTAWHLLVASSPALLKEGRADIWDSGETPSEESHLVPYGGPALEPMKTYYWKVRTCDSRGIPSKWSAPARWTTGPDRDGWQAQWIGAPWQEDVPGSRYTAAPMFRKEFEVGAGLAEAKAFVCGLGWFEMSLNGRKVGEDFFTPGLTDCTRRPRLDVSPRIPVSPDVAAYRTLYLGYDITKALKKGPNAIGILLGNGYFHTDPADTRTESYGVPRLICQIQLTYGDGHREYVCSDTSWKVAESPIVFNDLYDGEIYDAGKEVRGWNEPGLDDSAWPQAAPRKAPDGALTAATGPADKVMETLRPVSFEKLEDGSWKVDFGKVISGWIRFKGVAGAAGDTLSIKYLSEYPASGAYLFAGTEPVDWSPRFAWYVFRDAVIRGVADLRPEQLVAESVHSDVPVNATFECSNPLFERINEIWRTAQQDNMHAGVASDCPHRERLPYTGDGQVAMNTVLSNFDAAAFYNKWIADIRGCQNPETGYVTNGAPWEPFCGGGVPWGAAICIMPWEFYCRYGDTAMLRDSFSAMQEYVRYLESWKTPEGTVFSRRKNPLTGEVFQWYNLGEWVPSAELPSDELVHTFYYHLCCMNTSRTAKVLGDEEKAEDYAGRASEAAAAFHRKFYDPQTCSYGKSGSNVFALEMGVPGECRAGVVEALRKEIEDSGNHLDTGIFGTRYLFEVLSGNGLGDLASAILNQRDFPSFGWWIEQGATTTWEQWDGGNSRNHPMFGGGLTWFYKTLAGVDTDPAAPGFRHILIKPVPAGGLEHVRYATMSPYGRVVSEVTVRDGKASVKVTVPVGCRATVHVPKNPEAAGLPDYEIHEVPQGTWTF